MAHLPHLELKDLPHEFLEWKPFLLRQHLRNVVEFDQAGKRNISYHNFTKYFLIHVYLSVCLRCYDKMANSVDLKQSDLNL